MGITYNGVPVEKVIYNGVELDKVIYNSVVVFEKSAYDYTFDESAGVLTLNNAPHSQSGDTLTIL